MQFGEPRGGKVRAACSVKHGPADRKPTSPRAATSPPNAGSSRERIAAATSPERFELLILLSGHEAASSAAANPCPTVRRKSGCCRPRLAPISSTPESPTTLLRTYVPDLAGSSRSELADQARRTKPRWSRRGASMKRSRSRQSPRPTPSFWPEDAARASGRAAARARPSNCSISSGARPCSSKPSRALRRSSPPRASGWSPTTSKPPRSAASCRAGSGSHILAEPIGRNTAAAIGLAAVHLLREVRRRRAHGRAARRSLHRAGRALSPNRARRAASRRAQPDAAGRAGHSADASGNRLRLHRTRAREAAGASAAIPSSPCAASPKSLRSPLARKYVASGRYLWNAGMFFWRVSTFLANSRAPSARRRTPP